MRCGAVGQSPPHTCAYSSLVGQRGAGTPAKPRRARGLDPAEVTPHAAWRRPTGQATRARGAELFCPPSAWLPLAGSPRGTCGRRRSRGSLGKRVSGELCGAAGSPLPTVIAQFQSSAEGRGLNAWRPVPRLPPVPRYQFQGGGFPHAQGRKASFSCSVSEPHLMFL